MSLRKGTILISGVSGSTQSELVVDTYEDLPTSNVTEFTRAFVKYPSLYDVTTIAELNYDISKMHDCSPYAEPDYSMLQANDSFTINYLDDFDRNFAISLMPSDGNGTGLLLFGYSNSISGSEVNKTPAFINSSGDIPGISIPAGWSVLDPEAEATISISFNDVPLIPAHLMSVNSTEGNPMLTNNFFVDCKKHWAGEYCYVNGMWKYQQTPVSPYYETSLERVPTSTTLYETIQGASSKIIEELAALAEQVEALEQEIHGGGGE